MFTGLIQDVGSVLALLPQADGCALTISTRLAAGLKSGDSLAVNGVCLTVGAPKEGRVSATVVAETLRRSTLGALRVGARVNLEPALRVGDVLGGHLVQGHVDDRGTVLAQGPRDGGWELRIGAAPELLRYVAAKGSITVDGVSLTVARLDACDFSVALVPHTLEATVLGDRRVGAAVNLEVDILAKYVERLLGGLAAGGSGVARFDQAWLREQGY
ncbi:MAG: riboflavin synthase [Proteobacteria bacterium]|nr:riboflavin synthase [Pseudomonadota bacterium]